MRADAVGTKAEAPVADTEKHTLAGVIVLGVVGTVVGIQLAQVEGIVTDSRVEASANVHEAVHIAAVGTAAPATALNQSLHWTVDRKRSTYLMMQMI